MNTAMPLKFIGLSGPSSSGKTTLAFLIKHILPNVAFILHEDDFCKEFEDIPTVNGYLDCDGPAAIDTEELCDVLEYMKLHDGAPPSDFESWQEGVFPGREEKALATVPSELIEKLKTKYQGYDGDTRLVLVDGFLLYHNPAIMERLDIKLFFRLSKKVAKERRMSRQGYGIEAKPDEFWKTEDYFEKIVWMNYSQQHGSFLLNHDVEGDVDESVCESEGIQVKPAMDRSVEECLTWALERIVEGIKT